MRKSLLLTAAFALSLISVSAQNPLTADISFSTQPAKAAEATSASDIITEQPEGTLIYPVYGTSQQSWLVSNGAVGAMRNNIYAVKIVRTDNAIYVQNMISQLNIPDYWVKGDIESDGTVVFKFPQHIYHRDATSTTQARDYYIGQLTPRLAADNKTVQLVPVEGDMNLRMKLEGDKLTQIVPTIQGPLADYAGVVGAFYSDGGFNGYGEKGISYRLTPPQEVVPPTSLQTKPYLFEYTDGVNDAQKRTVQIGVDGSDVWIQGVNQFISTSWIKGTLADGKVTFNSTYTGIFQGYMTYVTGLSDDQKSLISPFTLTVSGNDYVADQTLFVNIGDETPDLNNNRIFKNAKFTLQEISGDIVPATPIIDDGDEGTEYDEAEGILAVCFILEAQDSKGNSIDANKLYYNILCDGVPYQFDASLYGQTMTDVPYNYGSELIYNLGGYLMVFIPEKPKTVNVRAKYVDGDYVSTATSETYTLKSGVDDITADSPVVSSTLYTLDGRRAECTVSGNLYIRLDRRANGTATAVKFVAK